MNKTQHTPGPWHIGRRAGNPAIYAQDGAEVAQMLTVTNDDWRDNARLIAAAPDLINLVADAEFQLARLKGENLSLYARTFSALARAALAKAQGEKGGAL